MCTISLLRWCPGAAVAEVLNDVQQVLGGDKALHLLAEPLFQVSIACDEEEEAGCEC